eukprot:5393764-Prymnesium_polylepis.1
MGLIQPRWAPARKLLLAMVASLSRACVSSVGYVHDSEVPYSSSHAHSGKHSRILGEYSNIRWIFAQYSGGFSRAPRKFAPPMKI